MTFIIQRVLITLLQILKQANIFMIYIIMYCSLFSIIIISITNSITLRQILYIKLLIQIITQIFKIYQY